MIRLSNYKLEIENTEKLNSDISSAFAEINTELKKDDSLVANDLFDVDKKIEELKKSRKKWASGDYVPAADNTLPFMVAIDISNISFKPTLILCIMQSYDSNKSLKYAPVIDSENYCLRPQYDDSNRIWKLNNFSMSQHDEYKDDLKNIQVVSSKNNHKELSNKLKWYAFE